MPSRSPPRAPAPAVVLTHGPVPSRTLPGVAALAPGRVLRQLVAPALALALLSGCFGLPAGSADAGDFVTIQYTAYDLDSGEALRTNRSASFDVGSGASGLGLQLERSLRGRLAGDSFEVVVRDDPSLDYSQTVTANRTLAPIPVDQSAPRGDFAQFVGEPTIGLTFPAYGIYTGRVTAVHDETVDFTIEAGDGQRDPVPSVGSVLVTTVGPDTLTRTLDPIVGSAFSIAPPSPFQPTTPLGLQPGSYRVLEPTADLLQFAYSASGEADLIGKDLRIAVTVVAVTAATESIPTDNFGDRGGSPMLRGDPDAALGAEPPAGDDGDGHTH